MYLFTYLSRINIIYSFERNYNNVDNLSKLSINYTKTICCLVVIIAIDKEFLHDFRDALKIDSYFRKVYKKLEKQVKNITKNFERSNIVYQFYRLNINIELLYLVNKLNSNRVFILKSLKRKMLEFAHNNYAHNNYHRTLNRLKITCYFSKIRIKIRAYIDQCSTC